MTQYVVALSEQQALERVGSLHWSFRHEGQAFSKLTRVLIYGQDYKVFPVSMTVGVPATVTAACR